MNEHDHQVALFRWANWNRKAIPELNLMYAIPNGGQRNIIVAGKLKAEGVKAGVPDICLPYPRKGHAALYIELKEPSKGKVQANQKEWIESLELAGNRALVCYGWEEAKNAIVAYLN